ncbi:EPTC-inducible aldehyde dehydrogenase [Mycobacterium marinum]|nr:EPTC-inducible aldehyde dehydrogenase [Mycobacterium marinum]
MTVFARPGSAGALMSFESRYGNFIGGESGLRRC